MFQITPEFGEIVPQFHRQGNCVPSAARLLPKRALTLAQELLTKGVQAIKADSWEA
jgi:hypothetical protein